MAVTIKTAGGPYIVLSDSNASDSNAPAGDASDSNVSPIDTSPRGACVRASADETIFSGAKKPSKKNRPQKYDRKIVDAVFRAIASGKTLTQACADNPAFPSRSSISSWVAADPELKARYDTAIQFQLAVFEDQLIDLPDAIQVGDYVKALPDGTKVKVKTSDRIGKTKLQMSGRLARLRARLNAYGRAETMGEDGVFRVINSPDLDDAADA